MRTHFSAFARMPLLVGLPLLFISSIHAQTQAPLTREQILNQLDPQMAKVVQLYDAIKGTPITISSAPDARQQFSPEDAAKTIARGYGLSNNAQPVGHVLDGLTIPGSDRNQIPIRIYTPKGAGPFPVVVYFHGGGFVIATIDTYDASARALCQEANAIIVSVEYRKAPEAHFPAALDDAISSYIWVLENISKYDGLPNKVAVAGESAGGNLATEVAIAARDRKLQAPTRELLIYPVTSTNVKQTSDLLYTDPVLPLTTAGLSYFYGEYLPTSSDALNPLVAPIEANVAGLPPTTIIAAQFDPLLSDGVAYAAKLKAAGVSVDYQLYPGTTHEFFGMGRVIDEAKEAEIYAASELDASF